MDVKSLISRNKVIKVNASIVEIMRICPNMIFVDDVMTGIPRRNTVAFFFPSDKKPFYRNLSHNVVVPALAPCWIMVKTHGEWRIIGTFEVQHDDILAELQEIFDNFTHQEA